MWFLVSSFFLILRWYGAYMCWFNSSTRNLSLIFDWFCGEFSFGVVGLCCFWLGIGMANEGKKSNNFYSILGLSKECTELELKNAYRKLAKVRTESKCFFFLFLSFLLRKIILFFYGTEMAPRSLFSDREFRVSGRS